MKTFQQYEDKGHSVVRQKAMMTLIEGFSGNEILTQEHIKKVIESHNSVQPQKVARGLKFQI